MKTNVDMKVNVKHKYKFEGKEYDSIEDMPPEGREAFRKASAETEGAWPDKPKITYKGKQYDLDELPPHVREMYNKLQKIKKEHGVVDPSSGSEIGYIPEANADIHGGELPTEPVAPKAFTSWFRIVLIVIAIGMIYLVISRLHY